MLLNCGAEEDTSKSLGLQGDQGWMKELLEPQNPDGIINFLSTGGSQNLDN